jgi:hypothetical protein
MSGRDLIDLQGYGKNEVANALKSQSVVGGTDTITLSDHTTISFANVSTLTASDFATASGGGGGGGDTGSGGSGGSGGGDDGQHGHGGHGTSGSDDHGQIRDSLLKHS